MKKLDKAILCNIFIAAGALLLYAVTKNTGFLFYALASFGVYFIRHLYTISVIIIGKNVRAVMLCIALAAALLFITFPSISFWR